MCRATKYPCFGLVQGWRNLSSIWVYHGNGRVAAFIHLLMEAQSRKCNVQKNPKRWSQSLYVTCMCRDRWLELGFWMGHIHPFYFDEHCYLLWISGDVSSGLKWTLCGSLLLDVGSSNLSMFPDWGQTCPDRCSSEITWRQDRDMAVCACSLPSLSP